MLLRISRETKKQEIGNICNSRKAQLTREGIILGWPLSNVPEESWERPQGWGKSSKFGNPYIHEEIIPSLEILMLVLLEDGVAFIWCMENIFPFRGGEEVKVWEKIGQGNTWPSHHRALQLQNPLPEIPSCPPTRNNRRRPSQFQKVSSTLRKVGVQDNLRRGIKTESNITVDFLLQVR